jgi:hypothetical protein
MTFKTAARVAAVAGLALLSACSSKEDKPNPSCPSVLILADAEHFTQFRPGRGRDVTDTIAEGEITGFKGTCQFGKRNQTLEMTLSVSFTLTRGAANTDGMVSFPYFVAVPTMYPDPAGKAVIPASVQFPGNLSKVRYSDEEITLSLPLSEGVTGASYEVIIGFQLDQDQLEYNRSHRR